MTTKLTDAEEQVLEKARLEARREKSREAAAQQNHITAQGYEIFLARHSGGHGVQNGIFYDCLANRACLESWILEANLQLNHGALEAAFVAVGPSLAKPAITPYERRTDTQKSHVMPQLRTFAPPALVLPYTRNEVLSWSPEKLRKEVSKSPRHLTAVNKILAGQN